MRKSHQTTTVSPADNTALQPDVPGNIIERQTPVMPTRRAMLASLGGAAALGAAAGLGSSLNDALPAAAAIAPGWKDSVRAATVVSGTLATSFANGQTIDGVALATGDRILIKDQPAVFFVPSPDNGIYTVNPSGAPTRATDFNSGAAIAAAGVCVEIGTRNKNTVWNCVAPATTVIGSGPISFEQITSPIVLDVAASDAADPVKRRAFAVCVAGGNDAQTIQQTINSASLFGGGVVHLSSGTFTITAGGVISLPAKVSLVGDSQQGSTLNYTATGGNCVTVQGADSGAGRLAGTRIADLHFQSANSSAQVALFIQNAAFFHLERLQFDGFAGHAIRMVTCQDAEMHSCVLRNCSSQDGSLRAALRIESTASDPASNNLSFYWCDFETNYERDIDTIPNGKLQNAFRFVACKFENTVVKNGAVADANARILLDRVNNADFSGCFFFFGDLSSSVRGRAVILANNSAIAINIRGCYFNTGGTGTASFKAFMEFADVQSAEIVGNTFAYGSTTQQPSTAAIVFSGSSQKIHRAGNVIGFSAGGTPLLESGASVITARHTNFGEATIAVGTSVTTAIAHNLHTAPVPGTILVTPTTDLQNVTKWWINYVAGATTFTIKVQANVTLAAVKFAWRAEVPSQD